MVNDKNIRIDILDDSGKTLKSLILPAEKVFVGGMDNSDIHKLLAQILVYSNVSFKTVIFTGKKYNG